MKLCAWCYIPRGAKDRLPKVMPGAECECGRLVLTVKPHGGYGLVVTWRAVQR